MFDKKLTHTFYLKDKAEDWEDWIPVSSRRHDDCHHGQHIEEEHSSRDCLSKLYHNRGDRLVLDCVQFGESSHVSQV